jgi:hypothetical protein
LRVWQKICERRIVLNHRRQHTFWKNIYEESMLEKKLNNPGSRIEYRADADDLQ